MKGFYRFYIQWSIGFAVGFSLYTDKGELGQLVGKSAGLVIGRWRVRIPAGAAGRIFFSRVNCVC